MKSNHLQCTLIQFQERSPSTNQNTFSLDSMKVSWCSLPRPFRRKCQRRLNIKPGLVSTPQISQKQNPQIQQHRALNGRLLGLLDWAFLPAVGCRLIGNARVALSGMLTRLPSTQTNDTQRGGKGHKLLPAPYNSAAHQKKSKVDRWEDIKGDGLGACSGLAHRMLASHKSSQDLLFSEARKPYATTGVVSHHPD